jgi:hypothetical protein
MIIKIPRGQPELRLDVSGMPGDGPKSREGVKLEIRPVPQSQRADLSKIVRTGFWPWPRPFVRSWPPDADLVPNIVYPCFETDPEGVLVFRFDHLLHSAPRGRYLVSLWTGGHEAAELEFDLSPVPWTGDVLEARL